MKALLDAAAKDLNLATNILRAMLYAELYAGNELTHQRVMMEARTSFVQTLQLRIHRERGDHE
jgi:hypothetical protein